MHWQSNIPALRKRLSISSKNDTETEHKTPRGSLGGKTPRASSEQVRKIVDTQKEQTEVKRT